MNDYLSVANQAKAARIFNIVLIVLITLMALGIMTLNFSRENYVQISNQIYAPEKPLMDSVLLDLLLRNRMSIIILLLISWIAIKEIRIISLQRRLRINLAAFVGLTAYCTLMLYLLYSPILTAG